MDRLKGPDTSSDLKSQLRSSSILEVVVAMVMIVAVLGIALSIYSNVVRSSLSARRLRAQAILNKRMEKLTEGADTTQTEPPEEGWHLQQQLRSYPGSTKLELAYLLLLDQQQDTLAQLRQVIIAKAPVNQVSSQ